MQDLSSDRPGDTLPPEGAADLTFRGDIRRGGAPKILRNILERGESGILSFWNGVSTKRVFISAGRIVQITSNDPDERLGEILLVDGRITARQFFEASQLIRPGRKLGALLVEIKAIDPEDLAPALTRQARLMLFDLFSWTSGTYEMLPGDVEESEPAPLSLSSDGVIVQGLRALTSWSLVFAGIGSLEAVFARVPEAAAPPLKVRLTDDEEAVLSRVNGKFSVEQVSNLSPGTSFQTCRTLWMLSILGRIVRVEDGDTERARMRAGEAADRAEVGRIVDRFNGLFERIHAYLDSRPGEGASAFSRRAVAEIAPGFGSLFEGISLENSGRVDPDRIYENLLGQSLENRRMLVSNGLSELVYSMQFLIRQNYGIQEESVVSGFIRDGL